MSALASLILVMCMVVAIAVAAPYPAPTSYSFFSTNYGEPLELRNITVYSTVERRRVDVIEVKPTAAMAHASGTADNGTLVTYLYFVKPNATGNDKDVTLSFKITYEADGKTIKQCRTNPTFDRVVFFISDYVNNIGAKVVSKDRQPKSVGPCPKPSYSPLITAPQCDYFELPKNWTMVYTDKAVDVTGTERAIVVLDEKGEKDLVFHWYKEGPIAEEVFEIPPVCH